MGERPFVPRAFLGAKGRLSDDAEATDLSPLSAATYHNSAATTLSRDKRSSYGEAAATTGEPAAAEARCGSAEKSFGQQELQSGENNNRSPSRHASPNACLPIDSEDKQQQEEQQLQLSPGRKLRRATGGKQQPTQSHHQSIAQAQRQLLCDARTAAEQPGGLDAVEGLEAEQQSVVHGTGTQHRQAEQHRPAWLQQQTSEPGETPPSTLEASSIDAEWPSLAAAAAAAVSHKAREAGAAEQPGAAGDTGVKLPPTGGNSQGARRRVRRSDGSSRSGNNSSSGSSSGNSSSSSSSSSHSGTELNRYSWRIPPATAVRAPPLPASQQHQQQTHNLQQVYHPQHRLRRQQYPRRGLLQQGSFPHQSRPAAATSSSVGLQSSVPAAAAHPAAAPATAAVGENHSPLPSSRQRSFPPFSGPHRLRQQALRELERHKRIPPVNACSELPFPYLNAAAAAGAAAADSSTTSSKEHAAPKRRGLFSWLWQMISTPGSSTPEQSGDNFIEGANGGPSAASPRRSSRRSSSSSTSSTGKNQGLTTAAGEPAVSGATASPAPEPSTAGGLRQVNALLPKHLRLHLAVLLSKDDRLYYGETFASCVSHGCGFALYGGGVSRGGGGLWGKAALRRLGCGSLAGECVLLPGPSRGPQASLQLAGTMGFPCGNDGELRVADGLQTGLVLARGPRPVAGYCGFWRLDRRDGWGVLLRGATASKYEGQWAEDFRHGFGMQSLAQGCRYVGQFWMGQKHGNGVIVYPGGMMYAGEWAHGRIVRQELLLSSRRLLPPGRRRRRRSNAAAAEVTRAPDGPIRERSEEGEVSTSNYGTTNAELQEHQQQEPHRLLEQELQDTARSEDDPTGLRQAAAVVGITSTSSSSSSDFSGGSEGPDLDQRVTEQLEALRQFSAASAVKHWGIAHVQCLLSSMGCAERLRNVMEQQQVDGPALLALTDEDLKDMGVTVWEERRLLLLLVDLLLKLRHRYRVRSLYKSGWIARDSLLQRILIPAAEIDIEGPIGEGGYSRVYKATWRYTQSLDAQQRLGLSTAARPQQQQQEQHQQLWRGRGNSRDPRQQDPNGGLWEYSSHFSSEQQERRCTDPTKHHKKEPSGEMSVAVKTFIQRDGHGVQRSLYAELSVLSLLRHPNVLLLLGVVGPPVYGLVTEYVSGGSLFDLLHKQRVSLPLMRVVKLAREVALGMSYLHEKGVMHCDLKSPNILLTNNGDVRLCDFGLATIVEAAGGPDWWTAAQEHQQQQEQQQDPQAAHLGCVGTHHWMAPEILRGEAFTFAADVYSFGVVFWEMLVGDLPFSGIASASHLITVVGYGGVSPPLDKIPRPLRGFLKSCLQQDPSRRPTFAACAQLLQQLFTANLLDVEVDLNSFLGLGV